MIEKNEHIGHLIAKKFQNALTGAELEELEQWATASAENRQLLLELEQESLMGADLKVFGSYHSKRILEKIEEKIPGFSAPATTPLIPVYRRIFSSRKGWTSAAAVLLLAGGMFWWLRQEQSATENIAQTRDMQFQNIMPGKEGALLTLADGRQVMLDSLGNGVVASENGVQVILADGRLKYSLLQMENGLSGSSATQLYNTVSTPKGRQFQVVLPDGTKVWLNAASSLRYPPVFSGGERTVEITGEAYFEVAKNVNQPFRVKIRGQAEVEVLGTGFNVSAYENDAAIKTTLINGSIRVATATAPQRAALRPGQQAVIFSDALSSAATGITVINNTNIEQVLAWKNGLFNFEGASLEEVMKQLERWYDIEVVYKNSPPEIRFVGEMSKDIPLSDLLEALKKMKLHFRLEEGRRLVVTS